MKLSEKIDEFYNNLNAQAELYRALLGLAKRQVEEIAGQNIDRFLILLEEKKKVVREIEEIELATIPLRQHWENHKADLNEETRAKLRTVVDEIREILEELLELESESQQKLGDSKDQVEEGLRQVSIGSKAMQTYRGHIHCDPRFMDETG